jgi:hypothetical protein
MNKDELIRIAELAESKIFRHSEAIREIVFNSDYASPTLESLVDTMKTDLDILLKSFRQLSELTYNDNK